MNSLSFKSNLGWISIFEEKNKIVRIKFAKCNNKSVSKNLKKIKLQINNFLNKRSKIIKFDCLIKGNIIQKKVWRELTRIEYGKTKLWNYSQEI